MAKYMEIDGDATKPQLDSPNEIAIIPHVCNNIKVWGGGFTGALNRTFGGGPHNTYMQMDQSNPSKDGLKYYLGEISVCDVDMNGNIYVVNMVAQNSIISRDNPKPIKYCALVKCMEKVRDFIKSGVIYNRPFKIHTCRFGSELAGGSWDLIKELIQEIWVDSGIDVVIYNFKN